MTNYLDFTWTEVGDRIRLRRTRLGLSQQALAAAAGITQNGVFRLEAGETNPQLGTLQEIASALHCSVRELISGRSEPGTVLADRTRRVKRILESKDPAAITVMDGGITAAEALLDRVVRKLTEPPLRRIAKGEGRRSPISDSFWQKGHAATQCNDEHGVPSQVATKAHRGLKGTTRTDGTYTK